MKFSESFKQALESLMANKLRSLLTMLGIVMGVFSVITIVAIGNAAQAYMNNEFDKVGASFITITHKTKDIKKSDWLTIEDMEVVKKAAPEIKNIAVDIIQYGEIRVNGKTRDAQIYGGSSQLSIFVARTVAFGRQINDIDVLSNAKVVNVDELFAKRYFKKANAVGESIQIKNPSGDLMTAKIVGVLKSEGIFDTMSDNESYPTFIVMPVSTVGQFYNVKKISDLYVSLADRSTLKQTGERIVKALEFKHGNKNKYAAVNSAELQKSLSSVLGVVSSVLLVIAVITLIVGGIGIVNILLVSVTERIREIGIRKALGAQKKDIILQFITESIIMTGFSGFIGIILGIAGGAVISSVIKIPPVINVTVIIASFFGSITLGLIFGVYPAKRAADLDPIESLRYE